MRNSKSKPFDNDSLRQRFKAIKRNRFIKNERAAKEEIANSTYERMYNAYTNRNLNDLISKKEYLQGVLASKSSIKINCTDPTRLKQLEANHKNELKRIENAIKKCEREIECITNVSKPSRPKKKYNKNEKSVLTLTCTKDKVTIFNTYKSIYDSDPERYGMCPACRKGVKTYKRTFSLNQEKSLFELKKLHNDNLKQKKKAILNKLLNNKLNL